MENFKIVFSNPWFLFIILAGIVFTLIPHFMIPKRYRRNRNRIVSLVLHLIVVFLSVFLLAGMKFEYSHKNEENEILLLVDVSDSTEEAMNEKNGIIQDVLNYGKYDGFRVGVVTFGFNQVYAVPFTNNIGDIYDEYLDAALPDTSATDIAAAFNYAKTLFTYPETAKIVLISDGFQTDENATMVIRSIAASGIKVDVCSLKNSKQAKDSQVIDVTAPNTHISVNEKCSFTFTIKTNCDSEIVAKIYDNNSEKETINFKSKMGIHTHTIDIAFEETGLHDVCVKIESEQEDYVTENNEYHTFITIEDFNKVLVIERDSEATDLEKILIQNDAYDLTRININSGELPNTVDELREYDQVILCNIHIDDMPEGYDELLYSYVSDFGGGLLTIGGDNEEGEPNAYDRKHMYGTEYQEMLPVQLINYTPPIGVVFIVDKSGSMMATDDATGQTNLEVAILGARASIDSLTERDYVGVMTLDSTYGLILPLTPRAQKERILSGIDAISTAPGGGTIFYDSIERASQMLLAETRIDKRHIIIISDGMPGDQTDPATGNKIYEDLIEKIYLNGGVTTSIVLLGQGPDSTAARDMATAAEKGHGRVYPLDRVTDLTISLREDLRAPEIVEKNDKEFTPKVSNKFSTILNGIEYNTSGEHQNELAFTLDGFYGVKVKQNADLILVGDYDAPLYAQWNFGKGMVGSFMCDLNRKWSSKLLDSEQGQLLIKNIVRNLMPNESIRSEEIKYSIKTENYINQLSIFTELLEGESFVGEITRITNEQIDAVSLNNLLELNNEDLTSRPVYLKLALSPDNKYSRATYIIRETGIYELCIKKVDADGNVLAESRTKQVFSYSKEYDVIYEDTTSENISSFMKKIAEEGNGVVIADNDSPYEIFDNFIVDIIKTFDPRYIFMIVAMVAFLLDIAVRKFKFKWIHEIIKAKKEKK